MLRVGDDRSLDSFARVSAEDVRKDVAVTTQIGMYNRILEKMMTKNITSAISTSEIEEERATLDEKVKDAPTTIICLCFVKRC